MHEIECPVLYRPVYDHIETLLRTRGELVLEKNERNHCPSLYTQAYHYKRSTVVFEQQRYGLERNGFKLSVHAGPKTEIRVHSELEREIKKIMTTMDFRLKDLPWWAHEFKAQERQLGKWHYPVMCDLEDWELEREISQYPIAPPLVYDLLTNHVTSISRPRPKGGTIWATTPINFDIWVGADEEGRMESLIFFHECAHAIYKCKASKLLESRTAQEFMLDAAAERFMETFPEEAAEIVERFLPKA